MEMSSCSSLSVFLVQGAHGYHFISGQMSTGKMCAGQIFPKQMGTRTNAHQHKCVPDKWAPGQIGGVHLGPTN